MTITYIRITAMALVFYVATYLITFVHYIHIARQNYTDVATSMHIPSSQHHYKI